VSALRASATGPFAAESRSAAAAAQAGPRRFLLLACSQRKRSSAAPIAAIDLYDGPAFRLLRRYLRAEPDAAADLEVGILSAQHGLLAARDRVVQYDQRLTSARAGQLIPVTRAALTRLLSVGCFAAVHVDLGRAYAPLVPERQTLQALSPSVTFGEGSVGRRLAQLHDWLFGAPPAPTGSSTAPPSTITLRGVPLPFSREEVLGMGRRALADRRGDPYAFHAWFVQLDGVRVAPKWLVSQISGLSPGAFRSGDARRVLTLLGVPVERV
jgi:hypothetical protein